MNNEMKILRMMWSNYHKPKLLDDLIEELNIKKLDDFKKYKKEDFLKINAITEKKFIRLLDMIISLEKLKG